MPPAVGRDARERGWDRAQGSTVGPDAHWRGWDRAQRRCVLEGRPRAPRPQSALPPPCGEGGPRVSVVGGGAMNIALARTLRRRMPPAEARLWTLLRTEPFKAFHFRRQVPIGRFFADFASHGAKLVIEVDGSGHFTNAAQKRDAGREAFIVGQGYRVLRFTTTDVLGHLDGVGATILAALEHPHPTRPAGEPPSPQGGGSARALRRWGGSAD